MPVLIVAVGVGVLPLSVAVMVEAARLDGGGGGGGGMLLLTMRLLVLVDFERGEDDRCLQMHMVVSRGKLHGSFGRRLKHDLWLV